MSFHSNYEKWIFEARQENCPVCNSEPMPDGMIDVFETPFTWLNAEPKECIKWACHVTAKTHAVELFELNEEQLLGIMKDVQMYAKAIQKITRVIKINYEIHGNTLPHFHIHLYPRFLDDPFPGKPIDYNQKFDQYSDGEYEKFIEDLKKELII